MTLKIYNGITTLPGIWRGTIKSKYKTFEENNSQMYCWKLDNRYNTILTFSLD